MSPNRKLLNFLKFDNFFPLPHTTETHSHQTQAQMRYCNYEKWRPHQQKTSGKIISFHILSLWHWPRSLCSISLCTQDLQQSIHNLASCCFLGSPMKNRQNSQKKQESALSGHTWSIQQIQWDLHGLVFTRNKKHTTVPGCSLALPRHVPILFFLVWHHFVSKSLMTSRVNLAHYDTRSWHEENDTVNYVFNDLNFLITKWLYRSWTVSFQLFSICKRWSG